jgi:HEPN domain-containing protein
MLAGLTLLDTPDVFPELAGFHAQQCVEKAIKGFLLHRNIPFPHTHDLARLLDMIKEAGFEVPAEVDEAFMLTQYAVQTRYPGVWEPVTRDEARHALSVASNAFAWIEAQLAAG